MNDDHRPTEPVGKDKKPEGFAGIARHLNDIHPNRRRPISRQLVHKWYINRHYNRFPEPVDSSGSGTGRSLFDPKAVEEWYASHARHHGDSVPQQQTAAAVPQDARPLNPDEEGSLAA